MALTGPNLLQLYAFKISQKDMNYFKELQSQRRQKKCVASFAEPNMWLWYAC